MSISNIIKKLQNIMRQDAGVDGDAQRIAQIVWLLFLKIYDAKEELWEFYEDDYKSIIPEELRWRNWAIDNKDGKAITGDELTDFINNNLMKTLKNLTVDENTEKRSAIVKYVFEDASNYMKNGILLRQVINELNSFDFTDSNEKHSFNEIYETILKDLQSAGNAGEFYTPRPITDFIIEMTNPQLGESVADFACGTGGFLTSTLKHLEKQISTVEDREEYKEAIYGVEKKPLPYLLCITNMLLHDVDEPKIIHGNSLEKNVRDYREEDKFNVIVMNPPYGGSEENAIKINFPTELQTSETADLFVALILYRLRRDGRVGIVLPDGFLFGNDNAKVNIKKKLLSECNLHTIVRLPSGIFAPYTPLSVNLLFFDKTGQTEKIDYYAVPLPEGYKSFSKTKPFENRHIAPVKEWWNNRNKEDINAYSVSVAEVEKNNYNLDIKNPNIQTEEDVHSLSELMDMLTEKSNNMQTLVTELKKALEGVED